MEFYGQGSEICNSMAFIYFRMACRILECSIFQFRPQFAQGFSNEVIEFATQGFGMRFKLKLGDFSIAIVKLKLGVCYIGFESGGQSEVGQGGQLGRKLEVLGLGICSACVLRGFA